MLITLTLVFIVKLTFWALLVFLGKYVGVYKLHVYTCVAKYEALSPSQKLYTSM